MFTKLYGHWTDAVHPDNKTNAWELNELSGYWRLWYHLTLEEGRLLNVLMTELMLKHFEEDGGGGGVGGYIWIMDSTFTYLRNVGPVLNWICFRTHWKLEGYLMPLKHFNPKLVLFNFWLLCNWFIRTVQDNHFIFATFGITETLDMSKTVIEERSLLFNSIQ